MKTYSRLNLDELLDISKVDPIKNVVVVTVGWYAVRLTGTLLFETDKGRVSVSGDCVEGIDDVRACGASRFVTTDPDSVPLTVVLLVDMVVAVVIFA